MKVLWEFQDYFIWSSVEKLIFDGDCWMIKHIWNSNDILEGTEIFKYW